MLCYNSFGCNNRMYLYWRRIQSLWFELGKLSIMNYVGNSRNDKMYENKESIGWKEKEGYTNKQYSIIGFLHLQQMWMSFVHFVLELLTTETKSVWILFGTINLWCGVKDTELCLDRSDLSIDPCGWEYSVVWFWLSRKIEWWSTSCSKCESLRIKILEINEERIKWQEYDIYFVDFHLNLEKLQSHLFLHCQLDLDYRNSIYEFIWW